MEQTRKPARKPRAAGVKVADREAMIREAAYYRAEQRGFAPGYEWEDWLAAEAEVERRVDVQPASGGRKPAAKPRQVAASPLETSATRSRAGKQPRPGK